MKFTNSHNTFSKRTLLYAAFLLLLFSFITSYYLQKKPSAALEHKRIEKYLIKQRNDFLQFLTDTSLVVKLLRGTESEKELRSVVNKKYGVFLFTDAAYSQHELRFWNTQKILPPTDILREDGDTLEKYAAGHFAVVKRTLYLKGFQNHVIAYGMIPVQYGIDFRTDYFESYFAHDPAITNQIAVSFTATPYPVYLDRGKPLFYVKGQTFTPIINDTLSIILQTAALVLLLVYFHLVARQINQRAGALRSVFFFTAALISVRLVLYLFSNIFNFRQFGLFDPKIYAANNLHPSLGDLFINAIFFCWIVLYTWFTIGPAKRLPYLMNERIKAIAGWTALVLFIFFTFQIADIVRSLIADSTISFNVTNFFSLTLYTVVGFIILALLCLSYYYFTRILFLFINPAFGKRFFYIYFILVFFGLLLLTLLPGRSSVFFYLPVLIWLLMYTFLLSREHYIVHRFKVTMAGILFWIFIFSASLAAIILQENRKKEWNHRIGIAERYSSYNEANILNIINTEIAYLDSDFLVNNFWRFADKRENLFLRDSIIDGNTPAYVKNFNTKLFVYDSLNMPVNNLAPTSFAEWNNIYSLHSKPTGFRDIHYHESAFDKYTFITKRAIADSGNLMGTLFFISIPRKYNEGEIKPDLFKHNGIVDAVNETTYRIAVYENGKLTGFSSKYPFPISVAPNTIPIGVSKRINGDFNELWYKASTQKIVVIASKRETLIESITLFSYLFCAFLLMVAIVQLFAFFMKLSGNIKIRNVFWQLNIRSQVHGTIILVSALSFIIIGIATITFFIKRYNQNNEDKLNRTALIMVEQMREALTRRDTFDDIVAVHNSGSNNDLQQTINEVADIHNVDVNVYDPTGNLKITSQSEVYNKGVLSQKMHPIAFYKLRLQKLVQFVQKENLSSLQYLSMYYAVRDNKGDVRAYINVPYFLSQYELTQEISNFLVTIINLNAFIFLIAGIVALIIANKITRSFSVIGDKMKEIRLGKSNEEIEWTRNDEIGALVVQYNKMVQELERSADALAKSEREGAWREMARQVAHEIKNPLTPMKLSIQYLQKAVDNNQPNVKELTANVATTLVEQIDHLSKIAADFSRFANIGNRNIEQFDLHQTIDGLKDLYSTYPNVTVIWNKAEEPVPIEADRTHINRLFANLLANAVEACHKNKQCIIEINETLQEDAVLIEVKDNGDGIPAEMQPKIFTPNFTTKSSGTGLGLAMCKSIVEQADGKIWFTTTPGKGTSFFIQLPVL